MFNTHAQEYPLYLNQIMHTRCTHTDAHSLSSSPLDWPQVAMVTITELNVLHARARTHTTRTQVFFTSSTLHSIIWNAHISSKRWHNTTQTPHSVIRYFYSTLQCIRHCLTMLQSHTHTALVTTTQTQSHSPSSENVWTAKHVSR